MENSGGGVRMTDDEIRAEKLATAGLDETEVAFRLLQMYGERAPLWSHACVAAYFQRVNEALSE